MSTTHRHARLRQLSGDPTRTASLRDEFQQAVVSRFRTVRGQVREVAGYEEDVFGLRSDARLADGDEIKRFPTDSGKARAFEEWLREQLRENVLEPLGRQAIRDGEHWTAEFIRRAYAAGWTAARERLRQRGVSVDETENIFRLAVPRRQLRRLYIRTFENLQSITAEAAPTVREVLTQGLAEGVNPREMARRLTDELQSIQRTRAETLARTEVINSYSDATLDRYERAGIEGVTLSGEFATADDDRVCPICEALEGEVFGTDTLRDATFQFQPSESEPDHLAGEHPVKPPVHPRCRCSILPVIE